jgi:uncharacterized membrane protein
MLSSGEKFNNDDLIISRIIVDHEQFIQPSVVGDIVARVNVENLGNIDLEDVKVTVSVPELGLRRSVGPFKIDADDVAIRRFVLDLFDDVYPGEYYVKITAEDKDHRKTKYRLVQVG